MRGRPLFVVVVQFHHLTDVNANNKSRNTVGRTRSFVLHDKGVDSLVQAFFLLTGSPLRCGKLMAEVSYDFHEVRYL